MRRLLIAVVLLVALPASASARVYELPPTAAPTVKKIKRKTSVAVLVPTRINLDFDGRPLYASGSATRDGYSLELSGALPCGANACFLAGITADRGGPLGGGIAVALGGGVSGRYRPLSCGGSCSPPSIAFRRAGVRYEIQAKVPHGKADLVAAARSALARGPR